jgi:hypothetical protein
MIVINTINEATMKKTILLLALLLCGCTELAQPENFTMAKNLEHNPDCMDMHKFKIFQVLGDNYALANECRSDDYDYCFGAVVLLTPMSGIDFYDDMFVTVPAKKCAIQDGVYRYETKNNSLKTVPRIKYDYEFAPETEEELMQRLDEKMDELKNECKIMVGSNKKNNTATNLKKCDCGVDFLAQELIANNGDIKTKYTDGEALKKAIEKKCGKLPVDFW